MFEHNAKLDRWGNSMEFINGVAAGALNPFISAGEALGIGDILYGTRYAIDKAAMRNIAPLPAEGKFAAIGGLGSVAGFEKNTREAVDRWIQENPNAAETVEALVNVLPFAKVKNLTKAAKPGKAAVSGDFSKSYTCSFHGSTLVKTADGYKAIAHIQAGDRVFAKDETSGKTGYKPVTAQYGNPYRETVYIKVSDGIGNSQTLISNRIHPFYSQGKWIQAGRLKKGDTLLSESGAKQTVQNITLKQQPLKAYNLTVADWHTYFVKGDRAETEGVWVHNSCPPKRAPEYHAGTVSESNFLNAAEKWLGENYKSYPNGRYVSQDGMRQVRYGYHETNSSTHHGHFESYDKPNGRVIKNSAVTIIRD
ncbi:hypothetical protein COH34_12135 [Neisseria meningitidis]|nr:hypothetical protein COH91_12110 [Neisseria meningitidis]RNK32717.1 hypothetical protein COH88_12190 [Neisseria meningitidis]RNL11859.1 hypothetical protein COH85_12130 [Neisseria meningitidis]RQJ62006.1 hypothetical protein COI15_12375 [Neisseria meningitidis]RQJ94575.1 hypothetical protein COI12_12305 [Neisseria meningitidis]